MKQILRVVMAAVLVALLSLGSAARGFAQGGAGRPFITKWQGKAGEALKLPIIGTDYKLVIKNEKGEEVKTEEKVTVTGEDDSYCHPFTPTADGVYTVEAGPEGVKYMRMKAEWKNIERVLLTSNTQLLEVVQFGTVVWESMRQMFYFGEQMTFAAGIDTPDLTKVTDMNRMFENCHAFNQPLEKWDVSKVTNMYGMFSNCNSFNQPLNNWTVSQVIDMNWMFHGCHAFNQPLEKWDVSKVTNMGHMFSGCSAFNQPLEKWEVSQVTDMSVMFSGCIAFNQPLEKWDVSKVTNMRGMLSSCTAFNQPLEKWDVSKVTDIGQMFSYSRAFNQPLEKWTVSKVTYMGHMFMGCTSFNQPLNNWTVSQVADMRGMFAGCRAFNQPLEKWDVSKVTNMSDMFKDCRAFNQPLGAWKLQTAIGGLSTTAMSAVNYSLSLIGWAKQTDGASNIKFGEEVKGLIYNDAGKAAREKLIAHGWTFEGDVYKPSEKVAISLSKEGEGILAIEGYNDETLKAVAVGTELTVIATPKEGYTLTSLTAGTQEIFATKKFVVTGAVMVTAVFKEATKVAISLDKDGEGTLAIEGYNDETLKAVAVGTELTVIATPKDGYTLISLTAGTQEIFATKKFTVKAAVTVKAVFKKKENNGGGNNGGNNGGGNNGGGNNGGAWQPQKPGTVVEDAVLASLAVAPNPFTTQLRIVNPTGVAATYELVTLSGVVVRSGAFNATEVFVDTEALPAGLYFARLMGQNGAKRVVRVVKY